MGGHGLDAHAACRDDCLERDFTTTHGYAAPTESFGATHGAT